MELKIKDQLISLFESHFKEEVTFFEQLPASGSYREYARMKSANHQVIGALEKYQASARERMQHAPAFMDPQSHHVQQSIYIARWNPRAASPELGLEIVGHIPPEDVRYEGERTTQLESLADTPRYVP